MSKVRMVGFAGLLVLAAIVGGTIIGSVAATGLRDTQSTPMSGVAAPAASGAPLGARAAEACADFRRAFAANLGVDESTLAPAARAAAIATIDAAVADGSMTAARGDRLKARIEAADADGCALLAGGIGALRDAATGGKVRAALRVVRDGIVAAANALGVTPAELGARLHAGDSLKDIATDKSVPYASVSAAVKAAVKADLDAAVTARTITQERADRVLARLEANLADGRLRNARPTAPAISPSTAPGS